jgi:hypothetical protein
MLLCLFCYCVGLEDIHVSIIHKVKNVKVNITVQARIGAKGLQEFEAHRISRQSAHKSGKVSALHADSWYSFLFFFMKACHLFINEHYLIHVSVYEKPSFIQLTP